MFSRLLELLPLVKRNSHRSSFTLRAKVPLCSFLFPLQAKPAALGFGLVIWLRQKAKKETLKRVSLFLELLPRFTLTGTGELGTSFYSNEDDIPSSNSKISDNKKSSRIKWCKSFFGAATQIRTGDLILTKDALYLLSYSSKVHAPIFGACFGDREGTWTLDLRRDRPAF